MTTSADGNVRERGGITSQSMALATTEKLCSHSMSLSSKIVIVADSVSWKALAKNVMLRLGTAIKSSPDAEM